VPAGRTLLGVPWLLWVITFALGVATALVIALFVLGNGSPSTQAASGQEVLAAKGGPAFSWRAGKMVAPRFSLTDAKGLPISLERFRGRPVVLTFIDPLCTTFCPLEAAVLNRLLTRLPAAQRPQIVAVSVNRLGDNQRAYAHDARKWKLTSAWHWAVGSQAALEGVWKSYSIGVTVDPKTKDVTHTEAVYLVDRKGYQRALYLWPFSSKDLLRGLRSLNG
jgi:cytochrome oxidase Cu insertion factor (SCO1/SenC/PrrC family)